MWSRWTEKARAVIWTCNDLAVAQRQREIAVEQLLFALLGQDNVACQLLGRLNVDVNALRARALHALPRPEAGDPAPSERVEVRWIKPLLDEVYAATWQTNTSYVGTEHVLLGLLRHPSAARTLLETEGLEYNRVLHEWWDLVGKRPPPRPAPEG
jgi:ATP-dependent Clp protease ATP-binding subunit ClpC